MIAQIPTWLETPPRSQVKPPVETRKQRLPFEELSWQDFERLCLRLVRLEATVEHCQLYGKPGQEQEGIDIYARPKIGEKYRVYQCKRVSDFGPSHIREAVEDFLKGEWASRSDTFVLCTEDELTSTGQAEEIEKQSRNLKTKGITLVVWDGHQLSLRLKDLPSVVDDFFGRTWVAAFCGQEQAEQLGKRLDLHQILKFRELCAVFYKRVFNVHDPGLLPGIQVTSADLPFENRYVLPDIYDERAINYLQSSVVTDRKELLLSPRSEDLDRMLDSGRRVSEAAPQRRMVHRKHPLDEWLAQKPRSVILGGPGSGKSALLRFVAVDLLEEAPRLTTVGGRFGGFLPVWVPFPFWTKMISNQQTSTTSLTDLLRAWFGSWNEERLYPLVELALDDERLLLLVDGLDEWSDESAARIALDRLQLFIEMRDVPAIVASRPRGFQRLGMQVSDWQIGELGAFSESQQRELARIWFAHRLKNVADPSSNQESELEREAYREASVLLSELRKSPDLRELATVPLLLTLLIYFRMSNARLPQSRFKAYEQLIEHLISIHPKHRRSAALITAEASRLNDDEIKKVYAYLAYQIQDHFGEGIIEQEAAASVIEKFLANQDYGLGFAQPEARRDASWLLGFAEDTLGLLVRRSPREVGFFHRSLQEYLVSYHLSRMAFSEQMTILEKNRDLSQWREVILGLLQITKRSEEIASFVAAIERTDSDRASVYYQNELLAEIAFGDFNCSVGLARRLASQAFERVDRDDWRPHRERLLKQVLNGLHSTPLRELIKAKIQSWFPCRSISRDAVFYAMAQWPMEPEVIDVLVRGIQDEDANVQRAAARVLATIAQGDTNIGDRVVALSRSPVDPKVQASAIEGLIHGWPKLKILEEILEKTENSTSPELRLVSGLGRVTLGRQTEEDRDSLLHLCSRESDLDYAWKSELVNGLATGWTKDRLVKRLCLESVRSTGGPQRGLDNMLALAMLLAGYPQDDDVANFCANEIREEQFPFVLLHNEAWRQLGRNFRDHPEVVAAIDNWIPSQTYKEPEVALASLVGRTPTAKAALLSLLSHSSIPHWPAWSLLEGWGMQDQEVAQELSRIALGPAAGASRIGYLIPRIIGGKKECKERLLDLLRDSACERLDFVLAGFVALGETEGDTEVVDRVLAMQQDREHWRYPEVVSSLIRGYAWDERVREFAKSEISERNGNLAAMAMAYGNDADMRRRIIGAACPLPVALRNMFAAHLGEHGNDEFALTELDIYDLEQDAEVKTQASISYHSLLNESGQDQSQAIETLSRDIVCYGMDHDERRQAAFCGLVILKRTDIMLEGQQANGDWRQPSITISDFKRNIPLLKVLAQNWEYLKSTLADKFWDILSGDSHSRNPDYIWEQLCLVADEYPSARDQALLFIDANPGVKLGPNALQFLAQVRPRSEMLLEYCMNSLFPNDGAQRSSSESASAAAQLLGSHFGGKPEVLAYIMSRQSQVHPQRYPDENLILALCEGWPDSEELSEVYVNARDPNGSLGTNAYLHLICAKGPSQKALGTLSRVMTQWKRIYQFRNGLDVQPFLRRLRLDEALLDLFYRQLRGKPTPSEKATFPRMIAFARGTAPELREWCTMEINSQLSGNEFPEVGLDLLAGVVRPVSHSLLDLLDSASVDPRLLFGSDEDAHLL